MRDMIKREALRTRKAFNIGKGELKNQLQLLRSTL